MLLTDVNRDSSGADEKEDVMKVVVAIDSLKGSLTSLEAGEAIRDGVLNVFPDADVQVRPLADGGEGTVEALVLGMGGELQKIMVTGPHGRQVEAAYGILSDKTTAVMEMAQAAGITMVEGEERNPLYTTTYGVGEMICDAMNRGCRNFIVGIGGSATNDGGIGMLMALGYEFLDAENKSVSMFGEGLRDIAEVRKDKVNPLLSECSFRIACDVTNPLCGPEGCSAIYGPQKGATPEIVKTMDGWLAKFAETVKKVFPEADPVYPGTALRSGPLPTRFWNPESASFLTRQSWRSMLRMQTLLSPVKAASTVRP